ncbi:uncharacterized protein LOC110976760 [Acanthaster planci]|uniref:Uncharacterized protein LOC110976760 n=1 Tax=Acanthaster planci TaxID=133434 RepID=A0A8B7Y257_ACAPL|nr:uncharacterized protein LOC110976760 [Acanthaster planci]
MDYGKMPSDQSSCGCGREVIHVLRQTFLVVLRALRHPIRTLTHCRRSCRHPPYSEVSESSAAEDLPDDETLISTVEADEQNNNCTADSTVATDDRQKRRVSKRMKKTLRKSVQHYGNGAMLCGSPFGSTLLARDIQQRISLNHKYVEMQDVYVPSYGVFL